MIVQRRIAPAEFRRMPWRNGAGSSDQILSWPADDDDRFVWRAALATIERPGPFSGWTGIDRTFALVGGDPVVLDFGARPPLSVKPGEVARFRGEDAPACRLVGGSARAFNLMVRRGRGRGDIVFATSREPASLLTASCVCYAVEGACRVDTGAERPIDLDEGHALAIETTAGATVRVRVSPMHSEGEAVVASVEVGA
jgi:environmental stress-induced protein Ves